MKDLRKAIGIFLALIATITMFQVALEEQGAGLGGVMTGYLIFIVICGLLFFGLPNFLIIKNYKIKSEDNNEGSKSIQLIKNSTRINNVDNLISSLESLNSKGLLETEEYEMRRNELFEKKINEQKESLLILKEQGVIENSEYENKLKILEEKLTISKMQNSIEYLNLKSLYEYGLFTKEEFDKKIGLLKLKGEELSFNKGEGIKPNTLTAKLEAIKIDKYLIKGRFYTVKEVKNEFNKGNYIVDKKTLISDSNGSEKFLTDLPELSFLLEYFPPDINTTL